MNAEQTERAKAIFTTAQNLMWEIKTFAAEINGTADKDAVSDLLSAQKHASECRLHVQAAYLNK